MRMRRFGIVRGKGFAAFIAVVLSIVVLGGCTPHLKKQPPAESQKTTKRKMKEKWHELNIIFRFVVF